MMELLEVPSGLEGVIAFETEIAEPDKEGSALRYRGVDIEDLVGTVPFEQVWGLLVDGHYLPGLPPAQPHPLSVRSGDPRVDVQAALAQLAPEWGLRQLIDISDDQARDDLARASVMALSFVAQSARGIGQPPVPQSEIDKARSIPERFLIRWRGEADPLHVKAIDAYWISAAEHGMNASTFTARVVASTGADVAAALSGAVGARPTVLPPTGFPYASRSVTVTVDAPPSVDTLAGLAETVEVPASGRAEPTAIAGLVPVSEPSATETVRDPAVFSVTPFPNVCTPWSPAGNAKSAGRTA
jgi:hypothetical protein